MRPARTKEELHDLSTNELVDLVMQLQRSSTAAEAEHRPPAGLDDGYGGGPLFADSYQHPGQASEQESYQRVLDEQTRRTALLTQIALELNDVLDSATIIERVLRVTAMTLGMANVSIMLIDTNGAVETARSIQGDILRPIAAEVVQSVLHHGLGGWVLREKKSVVVSDIARDQRWIPLWNNQQIGSAIVLPIKQTTRIIGVLTVYHIQPHYFTTHDLLLMEGVAAQVSIALSAARHHFNESWRREQAFTLLSTSQYLTAERSPEEVATMLQEKSVSIFSADYGLLFLSNINDTLRLVSPPPDLNQPAQRDLRQMITDAAHQSWQQGTIITRTQQEPAPGQTVVALPLIHSSNAIGTLVLVRLTISDVAFSANMWSLLTVFTNFIASTCANMQYVARLRHHTSMLEELVQDRTRQLQRSRDTLRVVFDNMDDVLLLLDPQGHLLAANNSFCYGIVGRHPRTIVGQPYADIWRELMARGPAQLEQPDLPLDPSPDANQKPHPIFVTDSSGQQRRYMLSRTPVVDAPGTVIHYLECWREAAT